MREPLQAYLGHLSFVARIAPKLTISPSKVSANGQWMAWHTAADLEEDFCLKGLKQQLSACHFDGRLRTAPEGFIKGYYEKQDRYTL